MGVTATTTEVIDDLKKTIETLKDALVHAEERAEEAEKQRDGAMFHIGEVWMQRNRARREALEEVGRVIERSEGDWDLLIFNLKSLSGEP